jgi:hypothetical protein
MEINMKRFTVDMIHVSESARTICGWTTVFLLRERIHHSKGEMDEVSPEFKGLLPNLSDELSAHHFNLSAKMTDTTGNSAQH